MKIAYFEMVEELLKNYSKNNPFDANTELDKHLAWKLAISDVRLSVNELHAKESLALIKRLNGCDKNKRFGD